MIRISWNMPPFFIVWKKKNLLNLCWATSRWQTEFQCDINCSSAQLPLIHVATFSCDQTPLTNFLLPLHSAVKLDGLLCVEAHTVVHTYSQINALHSQKKKKEEGGWGKQMHICKFSLTLLYLDDSQPSKAKYILFIYFWTFSHYHFNDDPWTAHLRDICITSQDE